MYSYFLGESSQVRERAEPRKVVSEDLPLSLRNLNNTCFLNSATQLLLKSDIFMEALKRHRHNVVSRSKPTGKLRIWKWHVSYISI